MCAKQLWNLVLVVSSGTDNTKAQAQVQPWSQPSCSMLCCFQRGEEEQEGFVRHDLFELPRHKGRLST